MGKVKFLKEGHKYSTEDDRELISVSEFVKKFEPVVDWKKKAAGVAKREGKTTQEILDLWALKAEKGSEAGTILHDIREQKLLGSDFIFNSKNLQKRECSFDGKYKWSISTTELQNNTVYPELMIYDLDYMICGQSDKVIVEGNKINIYDYKTDKEIKFKGFRKQFKKVQTLLKPVDNIEDCNGNVYALKMSLYMYLLWKANRAKFKPGKIILEWCPLKRDEQGIPILQDGKPRVDHEEQFELPYLKKEVMAMLATLKVTENDK